MTSLTGVVSACTLPVEQVHGAHTICHYEPILAQLHPQKLDEQLISNCVVPNQVKAWNYTYLRASRSLSMSALQHHIKGEKGQADLPEGCYTNSD